MAESFSELGGVTVNQGTADTRLPQLGFHSVHGQNVVLQKGGRVARRKESFCKGLAFSNRPVSVNENVCIRLTEVSTSWSGVLRFGVTNVDPETYRTIQVPKFACPDLTSKEGFWAKALPERYSVEGNLLHFSITHTGDLYYGVNGVHKGVFLVGINISLPIWIIVDIYGNSVAVEFVVAGDLNGHVGATKDGYSCHGGLVSGTGHVTPMDRDRSVVTDAKIVPYETVTPQHRPLICTLKIAPPRLKQVERCGAVRIKWWRIREKEAAVISRVRLPTVTTVHETWKMATDAIRQAAQSELGITKPERRKVDKQAWLWTNDVKAKVQEKKSLYHVFLGEKTADNWRKYQEARKAAKKAVAVAKVTHYGDVNEKLESRDGERYLYRLAFCCRDGRHYTRSSEVSPLDTALCCDVMLANEDR
ncbi:unnamed protein product [Heligmosomoides polygyrus]|uniref:NHR domain-containing protein n=1 Tax=Heligmosomoides polygyrus TaxID=6339 RepID=A0A183GT40_HELPZ|nr:unnamed protein product [Heligmosomoides polygyrus]